MKKIFISLFYASVASICFAQQTDFAKLSEILPPSPNSASLGKFGGINPSLSTGAMSHSIPLYDYTSRDIQFPISISYYSNGIKVDELASRMGTSWNMNAGGVITHTVFGKNDLTSTRLSIPSSYPNKDRATLNFITSINESIENGGFTDAEPDIFSFNFNGYTGRFVLDANNVPILLEHSNLKIELIGSSEFKITDEEGVQYYFGIGNAKETSNKISGGVCGKSYYNPIITAWNLSTIIHPNRDTVWFTYSNIVYTYKSSISESIFGSMPEALVIYAGCINNFPPQLQNKTCESYLKVTASILNEIKSSAGPVVKFSYISRSDIPSEKLFDSVNVYYPNNGSLFKSEKFVYQKAVSSNRPFLTELKESSGANYKFFYNDINVIPPYLSFSKDYYGYYNGKSNNTLIPLPSDLVWRMKLPWATANREPVEDAMKKGALTKIVYPTGGIDSILYEGNTRYSLEDILPPKINITKNAYSVAWPGQTVVSENFTISFAQQTELNAICLFSGTPSEDDPLHNKGTLTINSGSGTQVYSKLVKAGESLYDIIHLPIGSYTIYFKASGNKTSFGGTLSCRIGPKTQQYINKLFSGIRVSKIITTGITGLAGTKKFLYSKLENLEKSSFNSIIWEPNYQNLLKVYVPCVVDPNDSGGGAPCNQINVFQYHTMSSSTLNNVYLYNSPVAYSSVIESFGDNFQNGGIEHQFIVMPNFPGGAYFGEYILSAPLVDNSWMNGKEKYTNYFRKENSIFIPVKKVFTSFKDDSRINTLVKAIVTNKKYNVNCSAGPTAPPLPYEFDAWDCQEYWHYIKWVYPDTIRTQTFSPNGQFYLEELSVTQYGNTGHALPTKTISIKSDKTESINEYYYPQDLLLTGTTETARLKLVEKHILSPILQQKISNRLLPSQLKELKTIRLDYFIYPNGLTLPQSVSIKVNDNPWEKRIENFSYNQFGKVIERAESNDVHEVYIWGYKSTFPVAKIMNATSGSANSYVNPNILDAAASDLVLRTEINKIRNGLLNAQVTTLTYNRLAGLTSVTDLNNKTTYYEYDRFGRLALVRDNDLNIIKKVCYNYAGQPEDCGPQVLYANETKSHTFVRNNCTGGMAGTSVTYTVVSGTYFSNIDVVTANNLALNDINLNGQTYANTNGSCVAPALYARIELENIYNDVEYSTADVYIRFYSNAGCTVPYSVSGLSVNYKAVKQICGGSAYTYNYVQSSAGTQSYLGRKTISRDDGTHHCDWTIYSVTPGSGYTAK